MKQKYAKENTVQAEETEKEMKMLYRTVELRIWMNGTEKDRFE